MEAGPAGESDQAQDVNPSNRSFADRPRGFNRASFLGAIAVGLLFLTIRLVLGQDSFVTIHDNLDSEIPWRIALANNPGSDRLDSIMNGLPVSFMVTRLNLIYAFYAVFPPFTAYILNEALVHAVAFAGMFLLLQTLFRRGFLQSGQEGPIGAGVALAFSLLPFYSIYGLAIAGQPLLLLCLLNLEAGQRLWLSYGCIVVYCFYSSLVLVGIFVLAVLACYALYLTLKTRTLNLPLWFGVALMAMCYGIAEAKLIHLLLYESEPSHRDAWDLVLLSYPLNEAFARTARDFLVGQYHAASQHLGVLGLGLGAVLFAWRRPATVTLRKRLLGLLVAASLLAVLNGFHNWDGLIPVKERDPVPQDVQLQPVLLVPPLAVVPDPRPGIGPSLRPFQQQEGADRGLGIAARLRHWQPASGRERIADELAVTRCKDHRDESNELSHLP